MSRAATDFATTVSVLLTNIERLLSELQVDDNEEKRRQVLNLINSLSKVVAQLPAERVLLRPTGETVKSISELLTPLYVRISRLRLAVLSREYEKALSELHVVESFEHGEEPGLLPLCYSISSILSLTTQKIVPEEVAPAVPETKLTPPIDLLYGVPPITVQLWNLLMRRGRLEKEEAKRALIPINAPEQLEKEFDEAWDILVEKGYAEMKIDKRGRVFLERK